MPTACVACHARFDGMTHSCDRQAVFRRWRPCYAKATKRGVTVDSRAIRSIRNFVTGMAVSSTLIISSNIMAQEVTEDSPFEMNCAGLTIKVIKH